MTARLIFVLLLCVLGWAAPSIARAQACGVVDTAIDFGTFDPTANVAKTAQGTVRVGCVVQRVPVTIQLDDGLTGNYANRIMTTTTGGGSMTYNLYTTATLSTVWGNGLNGTGTVACTTGDDSPNGCDGTRGLVFYATYPVFGRINASQPNAIVGTYTDTVVVTMVF